MSGQRSAAARILAPVGVFVVGIVLLIVIATSIGGSEDGDGRDGQGGGSSKQSKRTGEEFYVVEPGDSLTSISRKTGVSVERLSQLNRNVDPQALVSGEKLKLRP